MNDYEPKMIDGVGFCDEECPQHDGKRCELLGHPPWGICEPWAKEVSSQAARQVGDGDGQGKRVDAVLAGLGITPGKLVQLLEQLTSAVVSPWSDPISHAIDDERMDDARRLLEEAEDEFGRTGEWTRLSTMLHFNSTAGWRLGSQHMGEDSNDE